MCSIITSNKVINLTVILDVITLYWIILNCEGWHISKYYKKTSAPSSQRTESISTTKTNWLTLCGEIIGPYCDNNKSTHKYTVWAKCGVINVQAVGTIRLSIVNKKKTLVYYNFFLHSVEREQYIQCNLCSSSWYSVWVAYESCNGQ